MSIDCSDFRFSLREKAEGLLEHVRGSFPSALRTNDPELKEREIFHISLVYVPNGTFLDLGGGYSPIAAVLSQLGMKVTVVDTFANTAFYKSFNVEAMCDVLRRFGVNLVTADLRCYDIDSMFKAESVDSIASFDCLYFFHPRALLENAMIALKLGGKLTISFSNALSLLKRVKVVAGRLNAELFQDYFFNGVHQKYWVKAELEQLAKHLKLREQKIMGRNWSVYQKWNSYPKPILRAVDRGLRPIPSLCNILYLVGRK